MSTTSTMSAMSIRSIMSAAPARTLLLLGATLGALGASTLLAAPGTATPTAASDATATEAATPAAVGYRLTATPSDATPASGQTFRVSGRLTQGTRGVPSTAVRIQTLRGGVWQNLSGAQVRTGPRGGYTVRVILGSRGERTLRAIAAVPGPDPRARFVVRVH